MSQGPQFQPGDVVDGFVLGPDGQWRPVPTSAGGYLPPAVPSEPDYRRTGKTIVIISAVIAVLGILGTIVAVALVAGLLVAISDSELGAGPPFQGESVPVESLEVGDCFLDPGQERLAYVDVVPCSEPHDAEVVLADPQFLTGFDALPSDEAAEANAVPACTAALESYTGEPYADSDFDFWYILPSQQNWADGDRALVCAGIVGAGERTEGSIRAGDATTANQAAPASPRSQG